MSALPYIGLFSIFRWLICPSVSSVYQGFPSATITASISAI